MVHSYRENQGSQMGQSNKRSEAALAYSETFVRNQFLSGSDDSIEAMIAIQSPATRKASPKRVAGRSTGRRT
jgi:hypothetical protein